MTFRRFLIRLLSAVSCLIAAGSQSFPAGLTLVGRLDIKHGVTSGVNYSGSWGYVAPDLREYAILTTATGTAIIDITDTADIREVVHVPGPTSLWREARTYRDRLYVVTEAGGGTQIIDLSPLPDTALLVKSFTYTSGPKNTGRAHTIEIFDGHMYLNGCAGWGTSAQRGAVIFDLADPDNPSFVGEYSPNYFHDSYVRNDTIYGASVYSDGGIYIADITNKAAPVPIGKISYTGSGTHNLWSTKDGRYVISTDEIGSTLKNLKFWDLSALPSLPSVPASTYAVNPVDIGHNVFVRGDYAYVAWYTGGIAVADISDPTAPFTADSYDTSTLPAGYDGVWAVYPYFWSGKVIAGDMQNGLYVFTFDSLFARSPVTLLEPADLADLTGATQAQFRWTRVADPDRDPHEYRIVIDGPLADTTIEAGADTSFLFTGLAALGTGAFSWNVVTVDEANEVPSQASFTFTRAGTTVIAPAGGEALQIGSTYPISWATPAASVEISWSADGGGSWQPIATVPGSPSSYDWPVPDSPTAQGVVRVRDAADSLSAGMNAEPFVVFAATVVIEGGWDLVSVPSDPVDSSPAFNFPDASSATYAYDGAYLRADTLAPGGGYWIKHDTASFRRSLGTLLTVDTIPVAGKWNIVGSLSQSIPVAAVGAEPPTMSLTDFYGYSPSTGYFTADSIVPGEAYWVKCSEPGSLVMDVNATGSAPKGGEGSSGTTGPMSVLTFTSGGMSRTLWFTDGPVDGGARAAHALPPPPPAGVFDVRFAGGMAALTVAEGAPAEILVSGAPGPVEVRLDGPAGSGGGYVLRSRAPGTTGAAYALSAAPARIGAGSFVLEAAGAAAPPAYRLHQNAPNPFNPSTLIRYELAEEAPVRLVVYSLLGEKVATLVDGVRPAGMNVAEFRGDELPSGTYFYVLNAGGTMLSGKMLLAR